MLRLDDPWYSYAACARSGMDPDWWFASAGPLADRAIEVCDTCPVKDRCLEDAIEWEAKRGKTYRFGVWGGMTPRQRSRHVRLRGWGIAA